MKFKWSKESIALQPSDCKAEQNENVILNQRLVDIFEAHHYCIPIPPTLFAELVKERKGAKSLYVLHMRNGKPLSKSSFKSMRQTIESRTVDDPADLWTTAPHSKVVRTSSGIPTSHGCLKAGWISRRFNISQDTPQSI